MENDFFTEFINKHPRKSLFFNGLTYTYIAGGDSDIGFFILPGAGEDAYSSYNLIEYFEKKYRVVSFDYKGFNDLNEFLDFIKNIAEQEDLKKFILYGFSLGGFLAQSYVRRHGMPHALILSHTSSARSQYIKWRVSIPLKIAKMLLPFFPEKLFRKFFTFIATGFKHPGYLQKKNYKKYASTSIQKRAIQYRSRFEEPLFDREYIESTYRLGVSAEKEELKTKSIRPISSRNILILETENDPLSHDDGFLGKYYPNATVKTFEETGHLTVFIQIEKVIRTIDDFISTLED